MTEKKFNLHASIEGKADFIVFVIAANPSNGEHITDAQKDAAMNAAKSVLQMCGADVVANSTAILVNADDITNDAELTFDAACTLSEFEEVAI